MKTIKLNSNQYPGLSVLVDDSDYRWLCQYKWHPLKNKYTWYAVTHAKTTNGKDTKIYMHRLICGLPLGQDVDHINSDGLDNRRENLRAATRSQNNANQRRQKRSTRRFRGVYWAKHANRWTARIGHDGGYSHLGYYFSEETAAKAYDEAALRYFGEYARLNFPELATHA